MKARLKCLFLAIQITFLVLVLGPKKTISEDVGDRVLADDDNPQDVVASVSWTYTLNPSFYAKVISYAKPKLQDVAKKSVYGKDLLSDSGEDHDDDDDHTCISGVACSSHQDCIDLLHMEAPHIVEYPIVTPPICSRNDENETGVCTCGPGRCLSFSRDWNLDPFFYCGPCGRVGSQCLNTSCTDPMGECVDGFCECKNGIYVDLIWCYGYYEFGAFFFALFVLFLTILAGMAVVGLFVACKTCYQQWRAKRSASSRSSSATSSMHELSPTGKSGVRYEAFVNQPPPYRDIYNFPAFQTTGRDNHSFNIGPILEDTEAMGSPPQYSTLQEGTRANQSTS